MTQGLSEKVGTGFSVRQADLGNVPALRFPEFEGELQSTKLGELMEISSASRVHKDEWTEDGVPFFRSSDVVAAYKGAENKKAFISLDLFKKLSKKSGRLFENDLLVTGGGSIGVPYLVTSNDPLYSKDADLLWLKNGSQTNGQFIYAFLISPTFRKYLNSISHIGTISHYTIEQAKATPIRLPSLPEQKKIAAFLGVVDAKIAALRERRAGLERYKRGLMQALFSQTLRFTKPDGSAFPDWEDMSADELFASVSNKKHAGDLPILAITQEHGAVLRADIEFEIQVTASSVASYKIVEKGDFIISLRSFQGGIEYSNVLGICSPAYTILKPLHPISDGFFQSYFKDADFISRLSATVVGIRDGKQISYSAFSTLVLPYPSLEEQQKIADALSAMDAKIAAVSGQVAQMEAFKKGLLQQMFV